MLKCLKYLIFPTAFKCSIISGKAKGSGNINNHQLAEFAELAKKNDLKDIRIYGVASGKEIHLDFSGKLSEGEKQRFRNLWQIIK